MFRQVCQPWTRPGHAYTLLLTREAGRKGGEVMMLIAADKQPNSPLAERLVGTNVQGGVRTRAAGSWHGFRSADTRALAV